MKTVFYSLISLIIAIFFILLGIIAVLLPWSPLVRSDIITFILEDSLTIFLLGFSFVLVGVCIVFNIMISARKTYYHVKSGANSILVDENILQDYLNTYLKELFPKSDAPARLILKKNRIHIIADLPYIPKGQQEVILERMKKDLAGVFRNFVGYHHHFTLAASFQPERKESVSKTAID